MGRVNARGIFTTLGWGKRSTFRDHPFCECPKRCTGNAPSVDWGYTKAKVSRKVWSRRPLRLRCGRLRDLSDRLMAKFTKACKSASNRSRRGPEPPPEARGKPGRSWRGKIQSAPGLTSDLIVVSRRVRAHTPNGVTLYARWLLSRVFGVGQSKESEPLEGVLKELRPHDYPHRG